VQARIPAFCLIAFSPYRLCALRTYFHNQCEHSIDDSEECPEIELSKQERTIAVEGKYVV
jgi:hypothetical protein